MPCAGWVVLEDTFSDGGVVCVRAVSGGPVNETRHALIQQEGKGMHSKRRRGGENGILVDWNLDLLIVWLYCRFA